MKAVEPNNLPKNLLQARNPFQTWRSQRPVGSPIPESYWDLAVRLARLHGLSLTARVHASIITALKNGLGGTIPNSHPGNRPGNLPLSRYHFSRLLSNKWNSNGFHKGPIGVTLAFFLRRYHLRSIP